MVLVVVVVVVVVVVLVRVDEAGLAVSKIRQRSLLFSFLDGAVVVAQGMGSVREREAKLLRDCWSWHLVDVIIYEAKRRPDEAAADERGSELSLMLEAP
ncbi:hypothetical protein E2C01_090387 [Portunus trituberculatus]|uniref:Secreted protein n=1 Tax=Portunus trituberculatus TaxID=210409 RepID=A0A5B7JK41_PORTR|nr:hypothetical protein [Portunus trituberculatus]